MKDETLDQWVPHEGQQRKKNPLTLLLGCGHFAVRSFPTHPLAEVSGCFPVLRKRRDLSFSLWLIQWLPAKTRQSPRCAKRKRIKQTKQKKEKEKKRVAL